MQKNLYNLLAILFSVFWIVVIFLDYWQKHPTHYYAFKYFHYLDLTIALGIVTILVTALVMAAKKGKIKIQKWINGLSIFGLGLGLIVLSVGAYLRKIQEIPIESTGEFVSLLSSVGFTSLATYLIIMLCYSLGELLCVLLESYMKGSGQSILNIASGMMVLTLVLFMGAAMGLLRFFAVFMVLLFLLALNWRGAWKFIKQTLIKPIELPSDLNVLGVASFVLTLFFICINLVNIISPLPRGFDSLTLYINLPGLIRDYGGLVEGFQPYNWALLMSLGHILFGKTEVVMALSSVGGVLSLFAMYYLGKNWLKINTNYLLLALLIFYATPSIYHQSAYELKVDLGLLFICLTIVLVFVEWVSRLKVDEKTNRVEEMEEEKISIFYFTGDQIKNGSLLVLAALLSGFAMGIKLTSLFVFLGVLAGIWYALNGKWAFLAISFISLFLVFLLKLDDFSALRQYHYGVESLQWILLAIGLVLLFLMFRKDRQQFFRSIRLSVVYGLVFLLPFFPWIVKNYFETQSFSPTSLVNGKGSGPDIDMPRMHKNWVEYQQEQQTKRKVAPNKKQNTTPKKNNRKGRKQDTSRKSDNNRNKNKSGNKQGN